MATFGYAGKILRVDLSSGSTTVTSTTDYAPRFLGGRGIAAKIYWDEVSPRISAFDPENRLVFATGPLAGVPAIGGSRWQVCGKSPAINPEQFSYCNLGGRWGSALKFAGYDALAVQGSAEKPVYLFVSEEAVELRDASALWGKSTLQTREILKAELGRSVSVVAIGPAGENRAVMANMLADNDASGSAGFGAVMGSKKLKAVAVKSGQRGTKIAHPEKLREAANRYRDLRRDFTSLMMWGREWVVKGKKDICYGCTGHCVRRIYEGEDGRKGKFACQEELFYQPWSWRYYGAQNDVPFYAAHLCNENGLDTWAIESLVTWMTRCYRAGILTDQNTGIPISKAGSLEFIETLVQKVSRREGFGDILAQGVAKAADLVAAQIRQPLTGHLSWVELGEAYEPRIYITTALLYAMEPRTPIQQCHEIMFPMGRWVNWVREIKGAYLSTNVLRGLARRFWGSEMAADFSTYEGKALAAKAIQDREYAKESLILCDWMWPITDSEYSEDHVGDPTLESRIYSAVVGNDVDEGGLYRMGEKVLNLQRAILAREGHRGRDFDIVPESWYATPLKSNASNTDCLVPGRDGSIISRKGAVVEKERFERMKDEYYQLRGWDVATGLQTRAKLEELGLKDISQRLEQEGLLAK